MKVEAEIKTVYRFTAWDYDDCGDSLAVDLRATNLEELHEKCVDEFGNYDHYVGRGCWNLEKVQILTYQDEEIVLNQGSTSIYKLYPDFFENIFTNPRYITLRNDREEKEKAEAEAARKEIRRQDWLKLNKEFGCPDNQ